LVRLARLDETLCHAVFVRLDNNATNSGDHVAAARATLAETSSFDNVERL
jgi:hypothetical protein